MVTTLYHLSSYMALLLKLDAGKEKKIGKQVLVKRVRKNGWGHRKGMVYSLCYTFYDTFWQVSQAIMHAVTPLFRHVPTYP